MLDTVISSQRNARVNFKQFGVTHAISFRDHSFEYPDLSGIVPEENWKQFFMYDRYFEPGSAGHDAAAGIVTDLIEFARALPEDAMVGLNCQMGISRSTAAGLILWCARRGKFEDAKRDFWRCPREIGRHCAPNQTLLEIADDKLDLDGHLIEFGEDLFRMYAQRGGLIAHRKGFEPPPGDPYDHKDDQ